MRYVSYAESEAVEYVNINKVQFEGVIRDLLLVHLYRVEVYDVKAWKVTYKVRTVPFLQYINLSLGLLVFVLAELSFF